MSATVENLDPALLKTIAYFGKEDADELLSTPEGRDYLEWASRLLWPSLVRRAAA